MSINDAVAMSLIHTILEDEDWSTDTLNEIADVVRATGRVLE